jgi:hypothetical protein
VQAVYTSRCRRNADSRRTIRCRCVSCSGRAVANCFFHVSLRARQRKKQFSKGRWGMSRMVDFGYRLYYSSELSCFDKYACVRHTRMLSDTQA